jgi:hypothetical protein
MLDLSKYLERLFNVLDTGYFPHTSDLKHLFFYPYALYFPIFTSFWSALFASLAQHVFLFLIISSSFISSYLFLSEINKISKKEQIQLLPVLLTAAIYVINAYAAISMWRTFMTPAMIHYAFFPMFLAFSMAYFRTKKKKYLLLLLLISWIIFPAYNIIPSLLLDVLFFAAILISIKNIYRKKWIHLFQDFVLVWLGVIILSVPIVIATISDPSLLSAEYAELGQLHVNLVDLVRFNSPSLEKSFFYSGFPPLYEKNFFDLFGSQMKYLEPLSLLLIGGLILIGMSVIVKNKIPHMIVYPVLWTFFIFLITGSNPPFSAVKISVLLDIFKEMFRSVYVRFGEYVVLSSIPMIYLGIFRLYSIERLNLKLKKIKLDRKTISIILIIIFLFSSVPMINGSFLKKQSDSSPSSQAQIPISYQQIQKLNNLNNGDFLYITIPPSGNINLRSWNNGTHGYVGPDIFPFILNGETIVNQEISKNILELIIEGKLPQLQKLLPVKYIIVTFDQKQNQGNNIAMSRTYFSILKDILNYHLIYYYPTEMAVFSLPDSNTQMAPNEGKRIFIADRKNQEQEETTKELFAHIRDTLIYQNIPLNVQYNLSNQMSGIRDFNHVNEFKLVSAVKLKKFNHKDTFYPLFIEFPNATRRIYVAVNHQTNQSQWTINTGAWDQDSKRWTYNPILYTSSNELTFSADFSNKLIFIKENNSSQVKKIPMPKEWTDSLDSFNTLLKNSGSSNSNPRYGTIGIYSTSKLSNEAELNHFQLIMESNGRTSKLPLDENSLIEAKNSNAKINSITKINPSSFKVQLNASNKPFIISLVDFYDPSWVASVNGKIISSFPLYGVINGFLVNEPGQLNITIEYKSQKWFSYGILVAQIIFSVYLAYLLYKCVKITWWCKLVARLDYRKSYLLYKLRELKNTDKKVIRG